MQNTSSEREFWSIGEMSKAFEATPRALRFYEDKGLLSPRREGLNRLYGHRDRARLKLILRGKSVGLPLDDIREILDLYDLKDGQQLQMRKSLEKFTAHAAVLQNQRDHLDEAIANLNERIAWLESQLAKPASPVDGADAYAARARSALDGDTHDFADSRATAAVTARTAARQ
ncbi:MAG: MerR family DNA-binding transcriptional regulator [Hyphomonadaceae bacterium]|jgi:DNA-binding transcriptional MerR regulator|nr:MerR family DNA-binding transcriptional regulator [Hyphomonadaceae bacterium]